MKGQLAKLPRTSFLFISKFVFIGVHLSSKAEASKEQVKILLEFLQGVKKTYPNREIVCAGDLNSFASYEQNESFSKMYDMYPLQEGAYTTIKKRTRTQAQWKKAEDEVRESKDKVMSTMEIMVSKIQLISGERIEELAEKLLPADEHPFDHYCIVTELRSRNKEV